MFNFIVSLDIVISILLMIVVLMQSSKGGGLAGSFGGSTVGTVFGVRRTADFLSRTTTILASIFIALCLIANIFFLPSSAKSVESIIQRGNPTSVPLPVAPRSLPAATPQPQGK
ncbi:MAG: preprotein translocase subunit SecG [Bacteroidota bacterium]